MANYKKYEDPKKGLFAIHTSDCEYRSPGGWENKLQEIVIIGEDETTYIHKLQPLEVGRREGKKVIKETTILELGVHKTRLVRWMNLQLSLF